MSIKLKQLEEAHTIVLRMVRECAEVNRVLFDQCKETIDDLNQAKPLLTSAAALIGRLVQEERAKEEARQKTEDANQAV
jgi:cell division FtsZ-interacting protein ZapD